MFSRISFVEFSLSLLFAHKFVPHFLYYSLSLSCDSATCNLCLPQERQAGQASQVDPGAPEGLHVQPVHREVHADLQEVAQAHGSALYQVHRWLRLKLMAQPFNRYRSFFRKRHF